jgi:hypothetical protein
MQPRVNPKLPARGECPAHTMMSRRLTAASVSDVPEFVLGDDLVSNYQVTLRLLRTARSAMSLQFVIDARKRS